MSRYIDADETLKTIKKMLCETALNNFTTNREFADACEEIAEHRIATWISLLPSADVRENIHGKWVRVYYYRPSTDSYDIEMGRCSNCNREYSYDAETGVSFEDYKFCPNCGADMRGER